MESKRISRKLGFILTVILTQLSQSVGLSASDIDPGNNVKAEERYIEFEPVIVTATKQETLFLTTPIPLSYYLTAYLDDFGITDLPELSLRTPNLIMGNNGNTSIPEIFIRGIGSVDFGIGSDLSIGYYVDGVYISRAQAMLVNLYDIERIEVLRGPQGSLYGRNTIGGAINIITNKPEPKLTLNQSLTLGNYSSLNYSGAIGSPLGSKSVLGRFAYQFEDRDGYTRDIYHQKEIVDADSFGYRGSLWLLPQGDLDLILRFEHHEDHPTAFAFNPRLTGIPFQNNPHLPTVTDPPFNHYEPQDPYRVNHDVIGREDRQIWGLSSTLNWHGEVATLTSITALRGINYVHYEDTDGLALELGHFYQRMNQQQITQEFQLANDLDEQWHWLSGVYLFSELAEEEHTIFSRDLTLLLPPGNYATTNSSDLHATSVAWFGELTYAVTERLSLTAGLRYSYEEKEIEINRLTYDFYSQLGIAGFPLNHDQASWNAITPKFGMQYRAWDEGFIYGKIERGFKSGGFNAFAEHIEEPFDPEYVTSYEIGLKSQWFQRRLQFNLDGFYNLHSDLQVLTVMPGTSTVQINTSNAAEAREMGIECQIIAHPFKCIELIANTALLKAEYTDFKNAGGFDVSGMNQKQAIDASGNSLKRAPEFSSYMALSYALPLAIEGMVKLLGEHIYQSRFYFTETNESILSQSGYHLFNAKIRYESKDQRRTMAVFCKNLTDEEIIDVAVDFRHYTGAVNYAYQPPRTYGIEFSYKY